MLISLKRYHLRLRVLSGRSSPLRVRNKKGEDIVKLPHRVILRSWRRGGLGLRRRLRVIVPANQGSAHRCRTGVREGR